MSIDTGSAAAVVEPGPTHSGNAEIFARMHAHARRFAESGGQTDLSACAPGFSVTDFEVTYPNSELIVIGTVNGIPDGVVLQGVTLVGTPSATSSTNYAMASAANASGLDLPVAMLGASTSPSFPNATPVVGMVIITYTQNGTQQECGMTRNFTVG